MDSAPIEEGKLAEEVFHNDRRTRDPAREILDAITKGKFVRDPDASEDINDYAQEVRYRFDQLTKILEENGIETLEISITDVQSLIEDLKKLMLSRRNARFVNFWGMMLQLGGRLKNSHPAGKAVYCAGAIISFISEMVSANKTKEIDDLSAHITKFFEEHREAFRKLAVSIQRLDAAIATNTGWSLYDENFQQFLSTSAENQAELEIAIPEGKNKDALIELLKDRRTVEILLKVLRGAQRESFVLMEAVSLGYKALKYMKGATYSDANAFHFCEAALKGLVFVVEYKQNQITIGKFLEGLEITKKEYKTLHRIYGPR